MGNIMTEVFGTRFVSKFGAHADKMEHVAVELEDGYDMAIYKISDEIGVLFWLSGYASRDRGDLVLLSEKGDELLRRALVGHLYGWSRADEYKYIREYDEKHPARTEPDEDDCRALEQYIRERVAQHRKPVTNAIAETCSILGVKKLIKYGGNFPKVPEIEFIGGYSDSNLEGLTFINKYERTIPREGWEETRNCLEVIAENPG